MSTPQARYNARKRAERKEIGLCPECGKCPPRHERYECQDCYELKAKRTAELKKRRCAAGLCMDCGLPKGNCRCGRYKRQAQIG